MITLTVNRLPPRSYILDALDRSAETLNAGVALLEDEKATEAAYGRVLGVVPAVREALQLYSQVRAARAAARRGAPRRTGAGEAPVLCPSSGRVFCFLFPLLAVPQAHSGRGRAAGLAVEAAPCPHPVAPPCSPPTHPPAHPPTHPPTSRPRRSSTCGARASRTPPRSSSRPRRSSSAASRPARTLSETRAKRCGAGGGWVALGRRLATTRVLLCAGATRRACERRACPPARPAARPAAPARPLTPSAAARALRPGRGLPAPAPLRRKGAAAGIPKGARLWQRRGRPRCRGPRAPPPPQDRQARVTRGAACGCTGCCRGARAPGGWVVAGPRACAQPPAPIPDCRPDRPL
jgi:hypothetical protein